MESTNDPNASGMTCPDCHAVVADMAAHKQWHSRLVSDLATAVEKEILRTRSVTG